MAAALREVSSLRFQDGRRGFWFAEGSRKRLRSRREAKIKRRRQVGDEDLYRPPTPTASPSDVRKAFGFPSHSLSFDCGEAEPRRYFLKCIVTERQSLSAHQAAEPLFFCETQDEASPGPSDLTDSFKRLVTFTWVSFIDSLFPLAQASCS